VELQGLEVIGKAAASASLFKACNGQCKIFKTNLAHWASSVKILIQIESI